ncbi:MAG: 4a-hydroxytetrahydrobiopterin dehydratase [Burkholderiaceae bacterium]|nr:4a-hydroxytetrahydrobiopterin dehydratase [Burkholderiaceae bacterium]
MAEQPDGWESRGKLPTLFRRFDFERYGQTRDFVDALSALTEAQGVHPQNINFGSTYVNVTLDPNPAGQADGEMAVRINALYRPASN